MKKKNGFTLVELLAVIVILAIIMVIAIPSVLDVLNGSRKDSFYLYAQKLYSESISKYTKDLDENPDNLDCAVYDIREDLGLRDTGNFDGWVRVSRVAASSGKKRGTIRVGDGKKEIQSIKLCVGKATSNGKCKINETYQFEEGAKSVAITRAIKEGQVFCVSYQVPGSNNTLSTITPDCVTYAAAQTYNDTYDFKVDLSLTNKSYSVNEVELTEQMTQGEFEKLMDSKNLEIKKPSCVAGEEETLSTTTQGITVISSSTNKNSSGTTLPKTTIVSQSTPSTQGTITVNPTGPGGTTTQGTITVNPTGPTTQGTIGVDPSGGTTSGSQGAIVVTAPTTVLSNERSTTYVEITTKAQVEDGLMLSSLNVEGYNINFNPLTYVYEITIPNSITSLNVSATPKVATSQVNITGQNGFSVGDNIVLAEVVDTSTGKKGYYRIVVKRFDANGVLPTMPKTSNKTTTWDPNSGTPDPSLEDSNASLKSLSIAGYTLDFNPEVYEYTLETKGETAIGVSASPANKGAQVLVTGNRDIKEDGEIVISVKSKNGFYNKTYKIKLVSKKEENTTTKTFKALAIGVVAILIIALIIVALTRKNRARMDYDSPTFIPPENNQDNQNGTEQAGTANQLPQTPVNGQAQNPVPMDNQVPNNNGVPVTPQAPAPTGVGTPITPNVAPNPGVPVTPTTPVAPTPNPGVPATPVAPQAPGAVNQTPITPNNGGIPPQQ